MSPSVLLCRGMRASCSNLGIYVYAMGLSVQVGELPDGRGVWEV